MKRFGYALLPQFFRTRVYHDYVPARKQHATSYLDGLRGLAALCVYNYHYVFVWGDIADTGWGDEKHRWLIELPIIRLAYSGLVMVGVFFIVAGYTLAAKPLQLALKHDAGARDQFLQTMCSSVFRRLFRLYLPVIAISLIVVYFNWLGAFDGLRPAIDARRIYPEQHPYQLPSLTAHLASWFGDMTTLVNVWTWRFAWPHIDPHLWTIPVEFRASLVLYISLLFVARLRHHLRAYTLMLIGLYCLYFSRWDVTLYLWGAAISQIDVVRHATEAKRCEVDTQSVRLQDGQEPPISSLPPPNGHQKQFTRLDAQKNSALRQVLVSFGIVAGMYLMSMPKAHFDQAAGYVLISKLTPSSFVQPDKFIPMLGTALLFACLTRAEPTSIWCRVLTCEPVQYIGKVSFAFYLVHGPMLHMFGYLIPMRLWEYIGSNHMVPWVLGILVGWTVTLVLVLCAADVFSREVDARCVVIARKMEGLCFQKLL